MPALYRMVYDEGHPRTWYYCPPMTWTALLDIIAWRRKHGFKLPGHVVTEELFAGINA